MDIKSISSKLKKEFFFVIIINLICFCGLSVGVEQEITFTVEAGKKECFFQYAKAGETIDIEYQVIDGGHGDLDISFEFVEPSGRILLADLKRSEHVHRLKALMDGDYRFCFDNSFSTFNQKTVFFEFSIENENDDLQKSSSWENMLTPSEIYELSIQEIMDYVIKIRSHLTKARQLQDVLRSHEARDRNIAEENFFKVNTWSMFQIFFMIIVGLLQVFMVRSIFETDSKLSSIWKKLKL